jgi:ferredoxin
MKKKFVGLLVTAVLAVKYRRTLYATYNEKVKSKLGIPRISMFLYPYVYRLGKPVLKLTRFPVMGKVGHVALDTENSNLSYIPIHEDLELPEGIVAPVSIAEHFIRQSSYRFKMEYCPCREANDCQNFPHDIGCIWIGGSTAGINAPSEIGRLVSVEEAIEHLHRARDAGLVTVLGKFIPDAAALGVFKDHRRFMTMCNCCSCCCMVKFMREGRPEYNKIVHRLQGLTMNVDTEKCEGCGECAEACMFGQITVIDQRAHIGADCKGCGFCAAACPNNAISITIDDPTFIEEAVNRISGAVDVT